MNPVRRTHSRLALTLVPLALSAALLTACGDETEDPPATDPSTSQEPSVEPSPLPSEDVDTDALSQKAVAALAKEQKADAADIEVAKVEAVTWSDGSLGCAKKGRMYTQALVEGHRIVLTLDGTDYEYHSGRGAEPFYCAKPTQ